MASKGRRARADYRRFLVASHSDNTKLAYAFDVAHFSSWGGRIPSTPRKLAEYLAAFAGKLAFATLSRRVAGIHREHLRRSLPSPAHSELVRATLRGIGRTYTRKQRKVRPLLPPQLLRMVAHMRGAQGVRDKALILLGFMGGFRRSELVGLNADDVHVERHRARVRLRRSKTDQEGAGRTVDIPRLRGPLCAVRPLERWLALRPSGEGPLFTAVSGGGAVLLRRLTTQTVADTVKRRVAQIGLDPGEFSGHSLRAGFVTAAARAGALPWQIKQQTGHKSDAVLAGYIRDGQSAGADAARMIARR
jgi:integrase